MKSLVTGGAGFIGSHLVDALVERGHEVTVLDNLRRGSKDHVGQALDSGRATLKVADVRDYDAVLQASQGVDITYHLAAQSNVIGAVQDVDYSFTSNVVGTFNVLKAATEAGVERIIFASSREVYGEPDRIPVTESAPTGAKNPYGASKVAAEAYCHTWQTIAGIECIVLRFANVYGPRDRDRVIPIWIERARRGEALQVFGGDQILDFVWIGTAIEALLAAASCPQDGPINVGSGKGTSLVDLAPRILEATGSRSEIQRLPAREAEVVRFVADVTKMERMLNVGPLDDPLVKLGVLVEETEPLPVER